MKQCSKYSIWSKGSTDDTSRQKVEHKFWMLTRNDSGYP